MTRRCPACGLTVRPLREEILTALQALGPSTADQVAALGWVDRQAAAETLGKLERQRLVDSQSVPRKRGDRGRPRRRYWLTEQGEAHLLAKSGQGAE